MAYYSNCCPYSEFYTNSELRKYAEEKGIPLEIIKIDSKDQIKDLEETINKTPCELVIIGTPIDLRRVMHLNKPVVRVRYELDEEDPILLKKLLEKF